MADEKSGDGAAGEFVRLLTAALVGAAVGAMVALALAPKPGAEFREDIKAGAGTAAERAQAVGAKARELVAAAKEKIEQQRAHVAAPAADECCAQETACSQSEG